MYMHYVMHRDGVIPGDSGCGSEAKAPKGQFSCRGCKGSNLLESFKFGEDLKTAKNFGTIVDCDQSLSYKPKTS